MWSPVLSPRLIAGVPPESRSSEPGGCPLKLRMPAIVISVRPGCDGLLPFVPVHSHYLFLSLSGDFAVPVSGR